MARKKVIKRCPKGHEMDALWDRCPRCSGGKPRLKSGRSFEDMTMFVAPEDEGANATVIVNPSLSRSGSNLPRERPADPPPPAAPQHPAWAGPAAPAAPEHPAWAGPSAAPATPAAPPAPQHPAWAGPPAAPASPPAPEHPAWAGPPAEPASPPPAAAPEHPAWAGPSAAPPAPAAPAAPEHPAWAGPPASPAPPAAPPAPEHPAWAGPPAAPSAAAPASPPAAAPPASRPPSPDDSIIERVDAPPPRAPLPPGITEQEEEAASAPPPAPPASPAAGPTAPSPDAPARSRAKLEVTEGPLKGRMFMLAPGVYRIGKAPRDLPDARSIVVPGDKWMSKDHAVVLLEGGRVVLTDPGSTNGSFVNGEKVTHVELRSGDEIRLGESVFKFTVLGA